MRSEGRRKCRPPSSSFARLIFEKKKRKNLLGYLLSCATRNRNLYFSGWRDAPFLSLRRVEFEMKLPSSRASRTTRRAEISWKMFFFSSEILHHIFRRLPILTFWCRRQNLDTFSVLCYVWRVYLTIFLVVQLSNICTLNFPSRVFNNSLCLFCFFPILLDGKK